MLFTFKYALYMQETYIFETIIAKLCAVIYALFIIYRMLCSMQKFVNC